MNPFDQETNPQAFAQILQPQQAEPAAPDMPEGGMAEVLSPAGPSMFERGQSWAQNNPMAAQMLLGTFMRMAQGGGSNLADTVGQGVAAGAQTGLFHLAQKKQDREKAEDQKRQDEVTKAKMSLEERRMGISERQAAVQGGEFGLKKEGAGAERRYKNAMASKVETETQQTQMQAPLMLEQLRAKIASVQEQIASSRDARQTAALQRQLLGLKITAEGFQNDLDREFAPEERAAKLTGMQVGNAGTVIKNEAAQMELDDLNSMTPQERVARRSGGTGSGRTEKSEQEAYREFLKSNMDLFVDADGNVDGAKARAAWVQANTSPEQKQQADAEFQRKLIEARNSVRVGEAYIRPDGKTAIRKN